MLKKTLAILLMTTACMMFFILIFIEMNETKADHLHEQNSVPDNRKEFVSGVLDRFDKDKAVILMEDLNIQIITPKQLLPEGSKENMWFHLVKKNGAFEIVSIDYEKTESEWKKVQRRRYNEIRR